MFQEGLQNNSKVLPEEAIAVKQLLKSSLQEKKKNGIINHSKNNYPNFTNTYLGTTSGNIKGYLSQIPQFLINKKRIKK